MTNNKRHKQPVPDEPYTTVEMRLVCADSLRIRSTGEVTPWKADMMRVYMYIFNQCRGFESNGGKFFKKRETIWKCCGVSHDRLDKILKVLLKFGLIEDTGERRTAPGAPRGMVVYTAHRLLDISDKVEVIFAEEDNGQPVWNHERVNRKRSKTKSAPDESALTQNDNPTPEPEEEFPF